MLLAIRFGDVAKERGILPYRQVCSSFALSYRCLEVLSFFSFAPTAMILLQIARKC